MNIAAPSGPELIEIDPNPCKLCGCTIDQHRRIDTPEGPEFLCDDIERLIYLRAAELVESWERADPRDAWRHTGGKPPRAVDSPQRPAPYHTPRSTQDAFWHCVRTCDAAYVAAWLDRHPQDAAFLTRLWEAKNAGKT